MAVNIKSLRPDQINRLEGMLGPAKAGLPRLLQYCDYVTYEPGQIVCEVGSIADFLIVILDGRLRVMVKKPTGQLFFLRHAEPGESLGEVAMLDAGMRSATVEVEKLTNALKINRDDFEKLRMTEPAIMTEMLRYMFIQICREFRDLTKRLTNDSTLRDIFGGN